MKLNFDLIRAITAFIHYGPFVCIGATINDTFRVFKSLHTTENKKFTILQ